MGRDEMGWEGMGRDDITNAFNQMLLSIHKQTVIEPTPPTLACPRPAFMLIALSHISHFHAATISASLASAPARVR